MQVEQPDDINRQADGFMKSFDPEDEGIRKFLTQHGFVVINLLSEEEVEETVDSFWNALEQGGHAARRGDPSTWEDGSWPTRGKFLFKKDAETLPAFRNRTHPALVSVFRKVFGTEDLLTKIDKWGVMRGTLLESGSRSDWRWQLQPHWDCNPHQYLNEIETLHLPRMYQGLVALTENNDMSGGFRCRPGNQEQFKEWCERNRPLNTHSRTLDSSDAFYHELIRIPLKRGQFVMWEASTLHANYSNCGGPESFRLVQFLRMMDPRGAKGLAHREKHFPAQHDLPADLLLTKEQAKLFGRQNWNNQ